MGTAVPGVNSADPNDPLAIILNAFDTTVPKIDQQYYQLDHTRMLGRSYMRNFTKHPTCNITNKVQPLATDYPVGLETAFFEDQKLKIIASQAIVDGRADGLLMLNYDDDRMLSGGNTSCVYPLSSYITKEVDGCKDIWRIEIPWNIAKKCQWNTTVEDLYLIYRGRVIVHNQEWTNIDDWRFIRSVLRVKLRFQRVVSVETPQLTVTNQNLKKAAITKQLVALELGSPAIIEIGTLTPWPFKLYTFVMNVYPLGKVAAITYSADNCTSTQGQDCRQYWRTALTLTQGTCTLDGTYSLNWTVNCGEDVAPANCSLSPSTPSDFVGSVQFTLKSENFCAEITVDVGIVGNIKSFDTQSFAATANKTSFIVGRRGYYLVKINSDLNEPKTLSGQTDPDLYDESNPKCFVTFSKVELVTVTVKFSNGSYIRVWSNKAPADYASLGQFNFQTNCTTHYTDSNNAALPHNAVGFSFVFTRDLAQPPKSGKVTFTVNAEVQGTYSNTQKKRFVLATAGNDKSNFNLDSEVADDCVGATCATNTGTTTTTAAGTTTTTTTSATTTTTAATTTAGSSALIVCFILMIAALVI